MNKERLIKLAKFSLLGIILLLIPNSSSKQADRLPNDEKRTKKKGK